MQDTFHQNEVDRLAAALAAADEGAHALVAEAFVQAKGRGVRADDGGHHDAVAALSCLVEDAGDQLRRYTAAAERRVDVNRVFRDAFEPQGAAIGIDGGIADDFAVRFRDVDRIGLRIVPHEPHHALRLRPDTGVERVFTV